MALWLRATMWARASWSGAPWSRPSTMPTAIPPTVFAEIVQTNSFPATIAALLNEAEERYSSVPKHWKAKRRYPFWKACQVCGAPFACETRARAVRGKVCSQECVLEMIRQPRPSIRKTMYERKGQVIACAVCGKEVWRPNAWLKGVAQPVCSKQCNGQLRGAEWAKHAHKGRAAWTAQSYASYHEKMSGPNNPAWKGGVTYKRTHGNHKGARYVRCPGEFLPMARKHGYVMEHRLVVAQALGRCLVRSECVHHCNHDPFDNRLENLALFPTNQAHKFFEGRGEPQPIWSGSSLSSTPAASGA